MENCCTVLEATVDVKYSHNGDQSLLQRRVEPSVCITVPRRRLGTYGSRAFRYTGPTVWNSLPDESVEIWTVLTVLNGSWKQLCLVATIAYSALKI